MTSKNQLSTPAIIGIATLLASMIVLTAFILAGWNEQGATLAARYTARHSFYWFMAAWSASALAQTWPGGWRLTLVRRRRALGLSFAAAHSVHLLALLTAIMGFGHPSNMISIVGGGIGYVLIFAMAATSNDAAVKALGAKRWQLLHRLGGYFLIGIFIFDYGGSFATRPFAAVPALAVIATTLFLKARIWRQSRQRNARKMAEQL